jgi:hypothetical protein
MVGALEVSVGVSTSLLLNLDSAQLTLPGQLLSITLLLPLLSLEFVTYPFCSSFSRILGWSLPLFPIYGPCGLNIHLAHVSASHWWSSLAVCRQCLAKEAFPNFPCEFISLLSKPGHSE